MYQLRRQGKVLPSVRSWFENGAGVLRGLEPRLLPRHATGSQKVQLLNQKAYFAVFSFRIWWSYRE